MEPKILSVGKGKMTTFTSADIPEDAIAICPNPVPIPKIVPKFRTQKSVSNRSSEMLYPKISQEERGEKMNTISVSKNQENLSYAIYMIGGSYFQKASSSNKRLETRLRVQYMEQKQEKQIALEDKCLKYFKEKLLNRKALVDVWKQNVNCEFTAHGVRFLGPKYALCVTAEAKGKETNFSCQLFKKN